MNLVLSVLDLLFPIVQCKMRFEFSKLGFVNLMPVLLPFMQTRRLLLKCQTIPFQGGRSFCQALLSLLVVLILVSLYFDFNLSAVLMEGAWALVAIYGLIQLALGRTRAV